MRLTEEELLHASHLCCTVLIVAHIEAALTLGSQRNYWEEFKRQTGDADSAWVLGQPSVLSYNQSK